MNKRDYVGHVLGVPYPTQGHINPMLQFCKRLASKGLKVTIAITNSVTNSDSTFTTPEDFSRQLSLQFDTISDGYDHGCSGQAKATGAYLPRFEAVGSETLALIIAKHAGSRNPIKCIVYDSFLPWVLDVANRHGALAAPFFTQACAVNLIYYYLYHGLLQMPISSSLVVEIPGLPPLRNEDMPGFVSSPATYPAYFEMLLKQHSNVDTADFVLVNTFYELEAQAVDSTKHLSPVIPIGPTIPSLYLDNRIKDNRVYGLNLFGANNDDTITWLNTKPPGSVVYISFGSLAALEHGQMLELAWGIAMTRYDFLWSIRCSEEEAKLPNDFVNETRNRGLIVKWSPQVEVLANNAVGCFFSHCGWNSTAEALSIGVPMVAMPQWTDQPTNAKLIEDVWKIGIRVIENDDGIIKREEIEACMRKVMEGELAKELKANAKKWSGLAKNAVSQGGSSDKNINVFVGEIARFIGSINNTKK